ncbi:hypothetical protein HUK80_04405 [Flavobacterium sp. MAH-1]|uniref:Uncharacterized protein n=1 Tax=Flavobacterium agri TaxID=2743471 RepID=A0A7Y8Y059_9FLAO|nr:hypothetical protein [Flavobacterium agri]NUY80126.1 hypothetical protein [Flavobacterium agri]NYA70151.1 hypothetical protein [Flavobacterium agri]
MKDKKFTDDQEIDLDALKQKMGNALDGLNTKLFRMLQFFIKNIIIISVLLVVGIGLGFYLDRTQKTYDHELKVQPNFGSVDYLYGKINLLESKIEKGDTAYLKNVVGLKYPKKLLKIDIKPIVDVYPFANQSEYNFELLKVMAEDGSIDKIIKEPATSKNYPSHMIYLRTKDIATDATTIQPILKYLNNSAYYAKLQVEYQKNLKIKMVANDRIIAQIDGILDQLGSNNQASGQVYINQNTQLNDVIDSKDKLVREQGDLRVAQVNYDKIVKEQSQDVNIENTEVTNGKMKLFLPILFIGLFVLVKLFIAFYKKQAAKEKKQA